ncbi:MAG: metal ABC transporter substrate-binding protein [Oscillospiraceae bacterium]|nr:metal ABC transporter substrate-binding protein [Oscillospiraceae bacterium]
MIIVLLLTGCDAGLASGGNRGKIKIVSTLFPPYDFVRNIAGDKAEVSLLLAPSSDSHSYEPTPHDIIKVREADIFLYIGGASDEWTRRILSPSEDSSVTAVRLMDSVNLLAEETVEGMQVDGHIHDHNCEHEHHYFDEYDEHIWTSPRNAVLMTLAIADALCAVDPENADYYRDNAGIYIKKLEALGDTFKEITSTASRNTVVFADRFAFRYLTEEYGLNYFAAFPGCAEQTEPSALTLAFLIEKIREEEIPVVFYGELSDKRTANSISRETGAAALLLHSCHTVTKEELDAGTGYIELMETNAAALRKALTFY